MVEEVRWRTLHESADCVRGKDGSQKMNVKQEVRLYKRCLSKIKYETKAEIKRVMKRRKRKTGRKLAYYQCPHCKGFHLTKFRNRRRVGWEKRIKN